MRVLLTGATSFLGGHLLSALEGAGHEVVGTRHSRADPSGSLVQVDIGDPETFDRLPTAIDAVLHVAGVSTAADVTLEAMLRCNVDGARNVLRYAQRANASRLVYASTMSVHGQILEAEVTESAPSRDPGVYGASKLLGERIFAEAASDLPVAAIRLPGVLGRGAHRAWLPTVLEKIIAGQPISAHSGDAMFNNAAHVRDLADLIEGMLRASWSGFHAFPVGAEGAIPVREVIGRMMRAAGRDVPVTFAPAAARADRPNFTISSEYAKSTFAYRPMSIGSMVERFAKESLLETGAGRTAP
jgi:nucleoside-diphosphate-sugar epimerase